MVAFRTSTSSSGDVKYEDTALLSMGPPSRDLLRVFFRVAKNRGVFSAAAIANLVVSKNDMVSITDASEPLLDSMLRLVLSGVGLSSSSTDANPSLAITRPTAFLNISFLNETSLRAKPPKAGGAVEGLRKLVELS